MKCHMCTGLLLASLVISILPCSLIGKTLTLFILNAASFKNKPSNMKSEFELITSCQIQSFKSIMHC